MTFSTREPAPLTSRRQVLAGMVGSLATLVFTTVLPRFARAAPTTHEVVINAFKFEPATLKVAVGDTVKWTNKDTAPHTATANDKSWDTGNIAKGETKSVEIKAGQSGGYACRFHPQMKATLEVGPAV